jgi:hypothetical protein
MREEDDCCTEMDMLMVAKPWADPTGKGPFEENIRWRWLRDNRDKVVSHQRLDDDGQKQPRGRCAALTAKPSQE